jgi:hypothetical protein
MKLISLIMSIFALSFVIPARASDVIINSDSRLFDQAFLARGYLSHKERRSFSVLNNGGYLGPFNCADSAFAGSVELCQRESLNIFWLNLETGIFEAKYGTSEAPKNIYLDSSLKINFFNEVAIVSFNESFMSYAINPKYSPSGDVLKNKTVRKFIPNVIDCSTDGLLVFDVLRNQPGHFELDENDRQDDILKELSGNNLYPYVLVYRDDDDFWSGNAKFITGRNIYVFIGESDLRIISRVSDQLCSFHYWMNQVVGYRNIEVGLRKR